MDHVGFSIYNRLLLGDKLALHDLAIEGDEPEQVFPGVLDRIAGLIDAVSALGIRVGGTLHLCDVGLIRQEFVRQSWLDAVAAWKNRSFLLGYHVNYAHENLPLAPGFLKTFRDAARDCNQLGVDAMVVHAPLLTTENTDASFVSEVTSEPFIDAMRACNATVCWENAQDPAARYKRLDMLLAWRDMLVQELERLGHGELTKRHQFCLDTGHLLLAIQRDGVEKSHADHYLPAFAKHVKVFHVHVNDGTADQHVLPFTDARIVPQAPKVVNPARLDKNSRIVERWLRICDEHKDVANRHVHLEASSPAPFTEMVAFYKRYYSSR